jgi:glycine cleavage system H protein
MSIPTDCKYTESHEWVRVEGSTVTMGITQYAADELTDITFVELPQVGDEVSTGSACGEIESVKATSEFISAVAGKVVAVNTELADQPELINEDAFGKGWMIKVEASDLGALESLMDAAAYEKHIAAES